MAAYRPVPLLAMRAGARRSCAPAHHGRIADAGVFSRVGLPICFAAGRKWAAVGTVAFIDVGAGFVVAALVTRGTGVAAVFSGDGLPFRLAAGALVPAVYVCTFIDVVAGGIQPSPFVPWSPGAGVFGHI